MAGSISLMLCFVMSTAISFEMLWIADVLVLVKAVLLQLLLLLLLGLFTAILRELST